MEREGLGLSVPPEDPAALADALYRLLSDPAMMEACRARRRRTNRLALVGSPGAAGRVLPPSAAGARSAGDANLPRAGRTT